MKKIPLETRDGNSFTNMPLENKPGGVPTKEVQKAKKMRLEHPKPCPRKVGESSCGLFGESRGTIDRSK